MVAVLVISLVIVVIGTVVIAGAGDVIVARLQHGHWHELPEPGLPFLIIPTTPTVPAKPLPVGRGTPAASGRVGGQNPTGNASWGLPDEGGGSDTGATVLFRRLTDEPLHVLPGRLEVLAGENAGEDIRFVGNFGESPEIVLGRDAGTSPHTLTLHSPTVSRRHARLEFAGGFWTITNLSRTNPVLLNDEPLPVEGEACTLRDGDRIELGEVVLRFHVR